MLLLSLGSNLGDRLSHLQFALDRLEAEFGRAHQKSAVVETEPFGVEGHPPYLNQVLAFSTSKAPLPVLEICQNIEKERGRSRKGQLLPRSLDIDILALGNLILNLPELILPHPSLHIRSFVLEPLCSILPGWEHPLLEKSASSLLAGLQNDSPAG